MPGHDITLYGWSFVPDDAFLQVNERSWLAMKANLSEIFPDKDTRLIHELRGVCEAVKGVADHYKLVADNLAIQSQAGKQLSGSESRIVENVQHVSFLLPIVLRNCPEYAAEVGGSLEEKPYDPASEKDDWDALRERWERERAEMGRAPLSTIPSR